MYFHGRAIGVFPYCNGLFFNEETVMILILNIILAAMAAINVHYGNYATAVFIGLLAIIPTSS